VTALSHLMAYQKRGRWTLNWVDVRHPVGIGQYIILQSRQNHLPSVVLHTLHSPHHHKPLIIAQGIKNTTTATPTTGTKPHVAIHSPNALHSVTGVIDHAWGQGGASQHSVPKGRSWRLNGDWFSTPDSCRRLFAHTQTRCIFGCPLEIGCSSAEWVAIIAPSPWTVPYSHCALYMCVLHRVHPCAPCPTDDANGSKSLTFSAFLGMQTKTNRGGKEKSTIVLCTPRLRPICVPVSFHSMHTRMYHHNTPSRNNEIHQSLSINTIPYYAVRSTAYRLMQPRETTHSSATANSDITTNYHKPKCFCCFLALVRVREALLRREYDLCIYDYA